VSDDETFAWKLQERMPQFKYINLGVVGYSTYQSLLYLEWYLKHAHVKPRLVVYGFIDHHPARNVADVDWLVNLGHQARRLNVAIPYCLKDKNTDLTCFPPMQYPRWVFDKKSYIINLIKDFYLRIKFRPRLLQSVGVTESLLIRMDKLCRKSGAKLLVVNLQGRTLQDTFGLFLKQHQISFADCYDPRMALPELQVPDGHPNGKAHTVFTDCIEKVLKK